MDVSSKRRRRFLPLGESHAIYGVEGGLLSKMLFLGSIIGDYSIFKSNNKWDRNYWDRPRFLPFRIFGFAALNATIRGFEPIFFPFYQFDLRPAKEPYDILL